MTKVTVSSDNGRYYIRAEGHATGSPTVCAAVSGIIYALAGYLSNNSEAVVSEVKINDAYAEIEFFGSDEAEAVYLMTVIGLMQIAEAHPEYIEVE